MDFCYSEEFDEFVATLQIDLQTEVENRMAALCLIDALLDIFEDWVYDATTEIANSRRDTSEMMVGIDDKGVIKMMQKMVGAGIPKARGKICNPNCPNDPSVVLLNHVCWMHVEAIADLEYVNKWYPPELRIENKGWLHLIHPIFVNWSSQLMLHAVNFFTELTMIKHRRNTVSVGLNQLNDNESIFGAFKEAALAIGGLGDMNDRTMKNFHSALAKQAFNAYTSFQMGREVQGRQRLI